MERTRVEHASDPRLMDYAGLRTTEAGLRQDRSLARRGLLMAEGDLVVRQLVRSRFRVRSVLGTPSRLDALGDPLAFLPAGTPVYEAEQVVMNALVGFDIHRGLLAAADRGEPGTLEQLPAHAPALVVLEDIANHDNMGGILRNVAALAPGVAVVLSPGCCDPLYRKAIRVSLGHALHIPCVWALDWPNDLYRLAAVGYQTVALTPDQSAPDIRSLRTAKPALLLGAEGRGLSAEAFAAVPARVRIAMPGGADSLNVAVACGIALYQVLGPKPVTQEPD